MLCRHLQCSCTGMQAPEHLSSRSVSCRRRRLSPIQLCQRYFSGTARGPGMRHCADGCPWRRAARPPPATRGAAAARARSAARRLARGGRRGPRGVPAAARAPGRQRVGGSARRSIGRRSGAPRAPSGAQRLNSLSLHGRTWRAGAAVVSCRSVRMGRETARRPRHAGLRRRRLRRRAVAQRDQACLRPALREALEQRRRRLRLRMCMQPSQVGRACGSNMPHGACPVHAQHRQLDPPDPTGRAARAPRVNRLQGACQRWQW